MFDSLDPDIHLPIKSNFNYYSANEFRNNFEISRCMATKHFSVLHCNIRSLNANFESLLQMLSDLNHTFTMIGLTETKINSFNENFSNYRIPGCEFFSQPSQSNAGGVGIFVSKNISCSQRSDISVSQTDFESLWIEIEFELQCRLWSNLQTSKYKYR